MRQDVDIITARSKQENRQIKYEQENLRQGNRGNTKQGEISREKARRMKLKKKKQERRRRRKQIWSVFCAAILVIIGWNFVSGLSLKGSVASDVVGKIMATRIVGNAENANRTIPQTYEGIGLEAELSRLAQDSKGFGQLYDNRTLYPDALLQAVCSNPEMLDYALGFLDAEKAASGGLTKSEKDEEFPLLLQWDKRWGYAAYGGSYIGLSGCAPTCLSMVVIALTGQNEVTPDIVANYAEEAGYYVNGTGTSWSLMTEGASHFCVSGREISLSETTVLGELTSGHPIICSMRPGDFTTQGHFIVLVGVEDGKIIVNDPNSNERSSLLWEYDTLAGQIKNLWAFEAE